MASVNKVIIIGYLGKDPDIKITANGKSIANFSIATSERYQDKNGDWQEKTEWHRIIAYGKLAEAAKRLHKGCLAYIEGKTETRSWEDRNGVKRYTTEAIAGMIKSWDIKPREGGSKQGNESNGGDYDDGFDQIQNPDDIPF